MKHTLRVVSMATLRKLAAEAGSTVWPYSKAKMRPEYKEKRPVGSVLDDMPAPAIGGVVALDAGHDSSGAYVMVKCIK